jgi:PAS domain S-box-containing protein
MQSRWFQRTRPATIQSRIRWLVIACIVPSWLLAVAVTYLLYERERDALASTTVQTAELLMQAVDRELATNIAVLQTLATSSRIDDRDFARFHERAVQVMRQASADNVVLFDPQLRGIANAARPFGPVMPAQPQDRFPNVMPTGKPGVSDLFVGQVSKTAQVAVAVPVLRDAAAIGRLEMVFTPKRFVALLDQQRFSPGWTAVILDRAGVIVARIPSSDGLVGKPASDALLSELKQRSMGSYRGRTREGTEVVAGFTRSANHGWSVAIGVPESILNARLRDTLALLATVALLLLAAGLALAGVIGRRIARPIQALVAPALAVGRGDAPTVAPTALKEAAEVGAALQRAHELLRERDEAREAAEMSLRESQSRLRVALDASRIGDWDLDLRTNVLLHSPRHDQCFGYEEPVSEWSVEHFLRHLHPDDRDRVNQEVQESLRSRDGWQHDCRVVWPDGSVHWLDTLGTILRKDGVPYRITGIVIDITERKQNQELQLQSVRLEAENRQIQEANRLKSEFLANMSHELRTPLNAVIGFAEILRSGAVPPESEKRDEYLGHIASSGRHLLQLINDVLDLSKVESGKFEFFPEPVDLTRLMGEVVGVLQTEAARKGVTLTTEVDPALHGLVLDPARLKQMLYNFLSNAIKFTGSGGRAVLRASENGPDQVRLEVQDTGVGISPADQEKLFAPFQQVNTGYAKQHQGTGLGLALTRRLAELQGGSVGVRSTPGVGSVFFVVLPRGNSSRRPPSPARVTGAQALPGAPTVLVIEDDAADQARLVQFLASAGFQVDVAGTGEQALKLSASRRYDAITLDLLLPDRSGLEVLAMLRSGANNRDVPVVVVTMVTETSALAGFRISDVLAKPIRPDEVVAALRRAGLRASATPRVMVVDDDPVARDLMAATLQSIGLTPLCVPDGHTALGSLDEHQPDAMVLDLMMPGLNGFDVLRTLRHRPGFVDLPVFVWTGMNLSANDMAALKLSARAMVSKGEDGLDTLVGHFREWQTRWQADEPDTQGAP